jgi:hypothetical protein
MAAGNAATVPIASVLPIHSPRIAAYTAKNMANLFFCADNSTAEPGMVGRVLPGGKQKLQRVGAVFPVGLVVQVVRVRTGIPLDRHLETCDVWM